MNSVLSAIALFTLTACASLQPLGEEARRVPQEPDASSTELVAVEGRPQGLVLLLATSLPDVKTLELHRVRDDEDPQLLQTIEVDAQLSALLGRGVELVDGSVRPGSSHHYQLVAIRADATSEASAILDVDWATAPPMPNRLAAEAVLPGAVELRWEPLQGHGAVVFRRDVLREGRFERVAAVRPDARGVFVDRDVRPGGVWSYRVALLRENASGLVQYGPGSDEVYAATPLPEAQGRATP